jgi:hypothetical protein
MTKQAAMHEAEQYVEKLMRAQGDLGYRRPAQSVVRSAVGEAAEAVRALSALSKSRQK